jgi:hypothetical protein
MNAPGHGGERESGSGRPAPWLSKVSASLTSNLPGAFDVQRLDDAVDDQHRIAVRAHTHAASGEVQRQAGGLA